MDRIHDNKPMKTIIFLLVLVPSISFANIGGSDLQNFNPIPNGLGYITVHSSDTLNPLEFNVGSFINFASNSLPYSTYASAPNNQSFGEPNDRLFYSNLYFALGLINGVEVGASAGFISAQDIDTDLFLFNYGDTGIDYVRLHGKVRLINQQTWGFALMTSADFEQIQNNPFAGNDAGPSFNFEGSLDFKFFDSWTWAVNLGFRLRSPGTTIQNTGVTPLSSQVLYSTALAYKIESINSAIIAEIYGSYPVETLILPTDRQISNLEILGGYRWTVLKGLDIHGGIGTELYHGLGSPDFRVFAGANFRLGFLQTDEEIAPISENSL